LGVDHKTITNDLGNSSQLGNIPQTLGEHWNEKGIAELANRLNLAREKIPEKNT